MLPNKSLSQFCKNVFIASLVDGLLLNRDSVNDLVSVIRIALAADLAYKESEKNPSDFVKQKDSKGNERLKVRSSIKFYLSG